MRNDKIKNNTGITFIGSKVKCQTNKHSNVVHFSDHIDWESICQLIDDLDYASENVSDEQRILLYFSSYGGSAEDMYKIVDYISQSDYNYEIVIAGSCFSAGCIIPLMLSADEKFLSGESTIEVLPHLSFGLHVSSNVEFDTRNRRDDRNPKRHNIIETEISKELDDAILKIYKDAGLSDEDLELLDKGQDLIYTSNQFVDMMNSIGKTHYNDYIEFSMQNYLKSSFDSGALTVDFILRFAKEIKKQNKESNTATKKASKTKSE